MNYRNIIITCYKLASFTLNNKAKSHLIFNFQVQQQQRISLKVQYMPKLITTHNKCNLSITHDINMAITNTVQNPAMYFVDGMAVDSLFLLTTLCLSI